MNGDGRCDLIEANFSVMKVFIGGGGFKIENRVMEAIHGHMIDFGIFIIQTIDLFFLHFGYSEPIGFHTIQNVLFEKIIRLFGFDGFFEGG